jgi:hypothetical protein
VETTKTSIIDYLGKFEGGIMVLISITLDSDYHEGIFYYTADSIVFNVDSGFEEKIGCKIEQWSEYTNVIKTILKSVVPFNQMIGRIDDVDFSKFSKVDSEIISATFSS